MRWVGQIASVLGSPFSLFIPSHCIGPPLDNTPPPLLHTRPLHGPLPIHHQPTNDAPVRRDERNPPQQMIPFLPSSIIDDGGCTGMSRHRCRQVLVGVALHGHHRRAQAPCLPRSYVRQMDDHCSPRPHPTRPGPVCQSSMQTWEYLKIFLHDCHAWGHCDIHVSSTVGRLETKTPGG